MRRWIVGLYDIDNIAALVAEGAQVEIRTEDEAHQRRVLVDFAVDRLHAVRQRRLGVGKIEGQGRIEIQNQPILGAIGRHSGAAGHVEDIAGESRQACDVNADRRHIFRLRQLALALQLPLGLAGAAGEVGDDILRQTGRRSGPRRRQQIDEQLFAGAHRIDGHLLRQRHADRRAVGIAPRRADIIGGKLGHAIDGHIDRLLEGDDQHVAGNFGRRIDVRAALKTKRA